MKDLSKGTIIRTICLVLALINIVLESMGKSIIPISDEQISEAVSIALVIITSLEAWWKNNSFTEEAKMADLFLEDLRKNKDK